MDKDKQIKRLQIYNSVLEKLLKDGLITNEEKECAYKYLIDKTIKNIELTNAA